MTLDSCGGSTPQVSTIELQSAYGTTDAHICACVCMVSVEPSVLDPLHIPGHLEAVINDEGVSI